MFFSTSPFSLRRNVLPLVAFATAFAVSAAHAQEWTTVTDGKSEAGLYKHASGTVEYSESGVFTTSGNGGYLATNKEYSHFRTRIEWNNTAGGNTGFLYHVITDRVWPLGLECQMASNDVGSLWTTGAKFDSRGSGETFSETGNAITGFGTTGTSRNHFIRSQDPGAAVGQWNTWEMYVKGDSLEIKANGKLVMRIWKLTINNGTPLVGGKIGLQIEGATVQWRNWEIQDLALTNVIAPMETARTGRSARLRLGSVPGGASIAALVGLPEGCLANVNGRCLSVLPVPSRP